MSLWVDKYRPTSLDKLTFHTDMAGDLKDLAASGDIPHLLVYGPPGAGKKTRVFCFLKEVYGASVEKLKIEHQAFKPTATSSKTVEISTIASNFHIEVNPSDVGIDDYHVVRHLLKEISLTQQLDSTHRAFKIVVINEADKLTKKAQQALRRIMEKYMHNCRYILLCNTTSKVIAPIRSRCLAIRIPAPTNQEIVETLQGIAKKEHVALPTELAQRIAESSGRNVRKAILTLESCKVQASASTSSAAGASSLPGNMEIQLPDWEIYIRDTARKILGEQSAARLLEVRGRLYELLTHCIPADVIMRNITTELIKSLDAQLKIEITKYAAEYEHRLQLGRKPIFHLEAFVAKFMSVYRKYMLELSAL